MEVFYLYIIIITIWQSNVSVNVIGTIDEDCQFYYRKLSTVPSTLATIEYFVSFNLSSISSSVLDIYTTEDNINLKTKCANEVYGQPRNENLHT